MIRGLNVSISSLYLRDGNRSAECCSVLTIECGKVKLRNRTDMNENLRQVILVDSGGGVSHNEHIRLTAVLTLSNTHH